MLIVINHGHKRAEEGHMSIQVGSHGAELLVPEPDTKNQSSDSKNNDLRKNTAILGWFRGGMTLICCCCFCFCLFWLVSW